MSDINSVIVVGRVTRTPQLKYLSTGTAVLELGIANNTYQGKDKGEKVNWLNVTVFGKRAESCEKYLDKGSQVVIQGKLDYQSWETKDGQKRNTLKIIADTVQFVGGKKNTQDQQPAERKAEPSTHQIPEQSDKIKQEDTSPVDNQENLNLSDGSDNQDASDSPFENTIDDTDDIPF